MLDTSKNYGNKYANGILPVGDSKYVTDTPTVGSIYLCRAPGGGGGASSRGPWFASDGKTYDITKKVSVSGEVKWDGSMTMNLADGKRTIKTNDLPKDHTTGVFPVASSDPAFQYDRNPNTIKAQSLTYTLSASPSRLSSPACMGGEVGVMTTGVALFNAFDAGGRDAGAWETQDGCEGHPQISGEYHYHTLSRASRTSASRRSSVTHWTATRSRDRRSVRATSSRPRTSTSAMASRARSSSTARRSPPTTT